MQITDIQHISNNRIKINYKTASSEQKVTFATWVDSSSLDWAWWQVEGNDVDDSDIMRWFRDRDRETARIVKLERRDFIRGGSCLMLVCEVNGRQKDTRIDLVNGSWQPVQGFIHPDRVNEFMATQQL